MNWSEKQLQWQKERQLDFDSEYRLTSTSNYIPSFHLCNVVVENNQFNFSSFHNNSILDLNRNKNYIFDLSDSSNQGYKLVISRVPWSGKIRDLTYQGIPGYPGSFVSFYAGSGRPHSLYFYDAFHKGLGGKINMLD